MDRLFCPLNEPLFRMRQLYTTLLATCFSTALSAQVPNGGFENWTGNVPNSWSVNNIAPLNFYVITSSADAHSGALAARGEVLESPVSAGQAVSPTLQSLAASVTQDPASVQGWYKFSPTQGTTQLVIGVSVIDVNSQLTGFGTLILTQAQSSYTQFSVPIDYSLGANDPAASVTLSFIISDNVPATSIGSWFLLDDVTFDGAQAISELEWTTGEVGMPYPTPTNGISTIDLTLNSDERIEVDVLDASGRAVAQLVDGLLSAGTHRLVWAPAEEVADGAYVLRLRSEAGVVTRRIVLLR